MGSRSKYLPQPELGQAKARSLKLRKFLLYVVEPKY